LAAVVRSFETVVNIVTSEPPTVLTTVRIATPDAGRNETVFDRGNPSFILCKVFHKADHEWLLSIFSV